MQPQDVIDLTREALLVSLLLGAPLLLVALAVGVVIGLIQSVTQIHDQTLAFVPKLLAVAAAFAVCLPWLLERIMDYSEHLMVNVPRFMTGG